jgi:hypothetical protein
MRLRISKPHIAALLVFAFVVAIVIILVRAPFLRSFYFEVSLRSSSPGIAQTFYDIGNGVNEQNSARMPLPASKEMTLYRFPLPEGDYHAIRFDPLDHGNAEMVIREARIVDILGHTVRAFPLNELVASNGLYKFDSASGAMSLTLGSADVDPMLSQTFSQALPLHADAKRWLRYGETFLSSFLGIAAAGMLWLIFAPMIWGKARPISLKIIANAKQHPRRALVVVSVISVMISCYPIVFLGRSFVSANIASMLYDNRPTLPGYQDIEMEDFKGSDAGAMMWQHLPYSYVEGRALGRDRELPLWNRYNSCGTTLIGQGQSMLGDPLNMMVLAAGETSWAWDAKFLLAKVLFCLALGLAVYASTRYFPGAALLCFSSAFIGFFSYRFDHPAYFSMCYAPWILLCWIELSQAGSVRTAARWTAGLVASSWIELTSGTAKEAYMLLLSMHGSGLFIFFATAKTYRWKKSAFLVLAGATFLLMASPIVLTFWTTLNNAYTGYKGLERAYQIPPGLFLGFFDDIFYRALTPSGSIFNPSANFLILLGCLFALVHLGALVRERIFVGLASGAIVSLAIAFGAIPHFIIEALPVVNHVWHTDTVFSCALIIQLVVLAGFGVRNYLTGDFRQWKWDAFLAGMMLFALLGFYLGTTRVIQRLAPDSPPVGADVSWNTFFLLYAFSVMAAALVLPWAGKAIIKKSNSGLLATPMAILCLMALHWREGFQMKSGLEQVDDVVVNPLVRVDFHAKSPALSVVRHFPGTVRTVGFGNILFAGYNGMAGVESISGPDALINPYYRELLEASKIALPFGWRAMAEKSNWQAMLPFYNLLNIGLFLDEPGQPAPPPLERIASLDLNVYENPACWPRAFFVDKFQWYASAANFLGLVGESSARPIAAIQNGGPGSPAAGELAQVTIGKDPQVSPGRNYKLTNNTTTFTVDAPGPGIVVLTEAYIGGDFIVRLNGTQCNYFRVNHAFRGILVRAAGTYEVSFSYWPKHFTGSLIMFGMGAVLLIAWVILSVWPPRPLPGPFWTARRRKGKQ